MRGDEQGMNRMRDQRDELRQQSGDRQKNVTFMFKPANVKRHVNIKR